ncbi:MAG: S41 family peptidase [Synergistaceae bacterium]|jgi:carboxyl-terminal processing protease|nr:S41 family peptidase [Synergistaceae bacterium]
MFKRLRDIFIGVLIGVFFVSAIVASGASDSANEWARLLPFSQHNLMIMKQARASLELFHVNDESMPDEKKFFFGAMKGMVAALDDPYTRFVDPEQLSEEGLEMEGEYGGLGMYIGQREGKVLVISPIEGTPAERVGVKPMDEIVKIDDQVVIGMDQGEVVKILRGAPNTSVTVWMRRSGEEELKSFDMTREVINIKTVRAEMMDSIGYIKLNNFHQKTAIELVDAIREVTSNDAEGIVLDMRNNPGGLLNVAVEVASQFLDGGLVVSMKGRVNRYDESLYAERGLATDLPLVVLINEGSASASEIVAGAIQDHKRGPLVGTKSYGKGLVQSLFPLPDNAGMYITIARYTTPSGKVIDHKGLLPDYVIEGSSLVRSEDKQLQKALGVMKNVMLSDSGGDI